MMHVYQRHAPIWGALVETAALDPRVDETYRVIVAEAQAGIADHIRGGQRTGAIRDGVDADGAAAWLTWMTERGFHELVAGAGERESRG